MGVSRSGFSRDTVQFARCVRFHLRLRIAAIDSRLFIPQAVSSNLATSGRRCGEKCTCIPTMPSTKIVARSFMLAVHAFRLLFLRTRVSARRKWWILSLGWFFVISVVSIGPLGIQNMKTRGPYFGPAGFWYVTSCPPQCAANAY